MIPADLVKRAKENDKNAQEELINRFKPFVIKNASSIFISGMDMSDIIQLGYISIIKAIMNFNPNKNTNFTSYVTNAIKNNYYYKIRCAAKSNYDISIETPIGDGIVLGETFRDEYNMEDDLLHREDIKTLRAALDMLSKEEKTFILYVFNGNCGTLKRYSKENGIKYTTVVKRKNRIIAKLRKIIDKDIY